VVDAEMGVCTAWHPAGDFFTDKEVRVAPQRFGAPNAVMVGQGDDAHAQFLAAGIDVFRSVVRLFTNPAHSRGRAHPRGSRVDVKVASHAPIFWRHYEQPIKTPRNLHECALGTY